MPSPLATSKGWVDVTHNGFVTVADVVNGIPVTTNGLPMTDDFDLGIHVRGELKPTALYSVQLWINQEPVLPAAAGVEIFKFKLPVTPGTGSSKLVSMTIRNAGVAPDLAGKLVISDDFEGEVYTANHADLDPAQLEEFSFRWTAPDTAMLVQWRAKVFVNGVEVDEAYAESDVR